MDLKCFRDSKPLSFKRQVQFISAYVTSGSGLYELVKKNLEGTSNFKILGEENGLFIFLQVNRCIKYTATKSSFFENQIEI